MPLATGSVGPLQGHRSRSLPVSDPDTVTVEALGINLNTAARLSSTRPQCNELLMPWQMCVGLERVFPGFKFVGTTHE